ncbi:MAG TPA: glyoxalase [Flavobacterium sp.]|nr:glyoxalase [Flavobacterium sp.]
MKNRNELILSIRGNSLGNITKHCTAEERFQNETLRPILKLNNDLWIASFKNYISTHKFNFYTLSLEDKLTFIESAIQKDIKYRNILIGMTICWFTTSEFEQYTSNSSNLNKRIINLIIERLKSQIQLFESV